MIADYIRVEISGQPGTFNFYDAVFAEWWDITDHVISIDSARGRSRYLDSYSAGTLNIVLNNRDRYFEPNYASSPFWPNITIRRAIRISRVGMGTQDPIFTGYINNWTYSYTKDGESIANLGAYDFLGRIAETDLGSMRFGRYSSGAIVMASLCTPMLDTNPRTKPTAGWLLPDFWAGITSPNIQASGVPVSYVHVGTEQTASAVSSGNALTDIYRAAMVENAEFWSSTSGGIMYRKVDWSLALTNTYSNYEWNLVRNPKLQYTKDYWIYGTRTTAGGLDCMATASLAGTPTVVYEDDPPGLENFTNLSVIFYVYSGTAVTSPSVISCKIDLSNDSGATTTKTVLFTNSPANTWNKKTFNWTDIEPGFTHAKVYFTSLNSTTMPSFNITKFGIYNYQSAATPSYWDGDTTDTATVNYGWDTPTLTATITNVRAANGLVTYKAVNKFTEGQLVTVTGVTPSSFNITGTIDSTDGKTFVIENAATGTYSSGGTATVIPLGTSWKTTEYSDTTSFNTFALSDDGLSIPYEEIGLVYGTEQLYNRVVITNTDGKSITKNNATSQNDYGVYTYSVSDALTTSKAESYSVAQRILDSYSYPDYRIEYATVRLDNLSDTDRQTLFSADIFDQCDITFTPNGVGTPLTSYAYVIGVEHSIEIDTHLITFRFATRP